MSLTFLHRRSYRVTLVALLIAIPAMIPTVAQGQVELAIDVEDVIAIPGQQGVPVAFYMAAYLDSVAGFELNISMSYPDLATFRTVIGTDSTLTSDWHSVTGSNLMGSDIILKVAGLSDNWAPYDHAIVAPQDGQTPLFYMYVDIEDVADSVSQRVLPLHVHATPPDMFSVFRPDGYPFGLSQYTYLDTAYFRCEYWDEGTCLSWDPVSWPPYDSIWIGEVTQTYVDTVDKVQLSHGSISIAQCGDVNGSFDGKINLADISSLINYVYLDGNPPKSLWSANVNASLDGSINLADISRLISFVYLEGSPLECYYPE